jgi:predicted transcriptional regulator
MEATTIKIHKDTKNYLDQMREYPDESYDSVLKKLVHVARIARDDPKLSQKTIREIDKARKRVAAGKYYTHEEVRKRLGL